MTKPWKIVHLELSKPIPELLKLDCEGIYVVFWWQGIPLGHQEIAVDQLPIPAAQLANQAVQAITPAVGDRLMLQGFNAPLSEHFERQPATFPDFEALQKLEQPLDKLEERRDAIVKQVSEAVSVVVCTRDRPEQLARCLRSLQDLSSPPHEIIVVDNAPNTDKTRQFCSGSSNIRYVVEPRPGLSRARNTGLRHITGDIVAFTDDDVVVHPDWIPRLQQGFHNPQVMAVTGLVLPAELETESQLIFEIGLGNFGWGYQGKNFDPQFFEATKHLGVPVWRIGAGANMAFRREIFDRVGYFDERLGAGASGCSEDSEFWYRILAEGWTCRYEPTAVVFHYHRREMKSLQQQMYQYMRGHVAALFIQFANYKHWGNLLRVFFFLPTYYVKVFLIGILRGFGLRHQAYLAEISGCFAGIQFYWQHRRPSN